MLDKGRINSIQLLLILLMADISTSIFTVPARVISIAGPDAWLSMLLVATVYGILVAWVVLSLSRRFPAQVFTEYLPDIVGRIPGKILAGIFAILLMHLCGGILSQGTMFVHIAFLRETPPLLLHILMIGAACYGACLGIEVIARYNLLLFGFFSATTVLVVLLVLPEINTDNFRPFLEKGFMPVLLGGKDTGAWRGEVFLLLMFYPYLNLKQEDSHVAYGMVILAGIYTTLITMATIGTLGSEVASAQNYPVYRLARYISIGQIIERIDIVVVIIWVAAVIIKLSIFLHAAGIAAATTLGADDYRWPLLGAALVSVGMALLSFGDQAQLDYFFSNIWSAYALGIELIFPAIILLLALLLKKKGA
ncbi:spore germination protein gerkb [hydrocarbon metagenome]|uniref:Spore germination protein gerkb n=1 Tax=hydrocarbon metagenome TaxID=938273 RepID=A0A0W8E270_9ZZZZ